MNMTKLDCSVVNCTYNKDNSCCKDNIHVGGHNARITDQTCCESFRERKYDGTRNADDMHVNANRQNVQPLNVTANKHHKIRIASSKSGTDFCELYIKSSFVFLGILSLDFFWIFSI